MAFGAIAVSGGSGGDMVSELIRRARSMTPAFVVARARALPHAVWKIVAALVLLALLGAWNIHTPWGLAGGSAARAEAKLAESARQRLVGVEADWAQVSMEGQAAVIRGLAPTEEELLVARGAVRQAAWAGGVLMGGVTRVRSDEAQVWAAREGAYPWSAELDLNRVTLRGSAPSREVVTALGGLAAVLFVDRRVVNELQVDPLPPADDWDELARGALAVLSRLSVGSATLADFDLTVSGQAATAEAADATRAGFERLDGLIGPLSSVDVRAPAPQPAAAAPAPQPRPTQPAAVQPATPPPAAPSENPLGRAYSGADCQARLDRALAGGEILFEVDNASLTPGSLPLLSELAEIAAACPSFALSVEGHTDDTGDAEANMALSERRAGTVVEALIALGIDRDRLTAQGVGAERPVADNATEEGRQANRRIEIIVRN
jgi:outer membrane protein OmpA-like peptidoglycan-associated protein